MFSTVVFFLVIGCILALAGTVCTYIFILPKGKLNTKNDFLNKLISFARDLFSFKELYLEKILQALYILATIACITIGACMLLGFTFWENWLGELQVEWTGGYGILLMILGPIAVRLSFELSMMFVLLVMNVLQINSKLKADNTEESVKAEAEPVANNTESAE